MALPVAVLFAGMAWGGCGSSDGETGVTITEAARSAAFSDVHVTVASPADSAVVPDPAVSVVVTAEGFETGTPTNAPRRNEIANTEKGQHLHMILDNNPYMANYTPGEPFSLGTLDPGPHSLIVFASRSYHESVKRPGAYDVLNFWVGEKIDAPFMLDPSRPTIVYSRPKGTYRGAAAEKILLDFYLLNVTLSPSGYRARYRIRRADAPAGSAPLAQITLNEWTPAFVTGLEPGEYVVRLQLINGEGQVVPGAFNDTERTITVEAGEEAAS